MNFSCLFRLFLCLMLANTNLSAFPTSPRDIGDRGRFIIPGTAAAISILMGDFDGLPQLGISELVATGGTEALKFVSQEHRPNGECCASFPSGHTSVVFASASYVHHRYGFFYSIPFYLGASYVGYSRVYALSHYPHDVLAGAAVGIISAWASTTPYHDRDIQLTFHKEYAGIIVRKLFD